VLGLGCWSSNKRGGKRLRLRAQPKRPSLPLSPDAHAHTDQLHIHSARPLNHLHPLPLFVSNLSHRRSPPFAAFFPPP
jgi:hypothetical protein